MKSRLEKVYSKLPNQKVNLKAHKVALSLVDDIQNNLDAFEEAESEASYLAYDLGDELIDTIDRQQQEVGNTIDNFIVNGSVRQLEELSEIIGEALDTLEVKAEELGVNPNDIISGFDDLKQRANNATSLNKDAKDKYKEIVKLAGFLNDFWS
jgi:uncharacterized phage infection (PIP) family protein YhgE